LQQAPFDLSYSQQDAIQKFVEQGKGWVGIHAAGLPGKDFIGPGKKYWQWYEDFLGGISYSPHPAYQKGIVAVEDHKHPVMNSIKAHAPMYMYWQLPMNLLITRISQWVIIPSSGPMKNIKRWCISASAMMRLYAAIKIIQHLSQMLSCGRAVKSNNHIHINYSLLLLKPVPGLGFSGGVSNVKIIDSYQKCIAYG
jgi:hypothetical protein